MITTKSLRALRSGVSRSEKLGARGAGVLEFRAQDGGISASFRYSRRGERRRLLLGPWEERSAERSLQALRRRAQELARRLQDGLAIEEPAASGTLRDLLADYVDGLENVSTRKYVRRLFGRTVPPRFLDQPAAHVSGELVLSWLAARVKAGVTTEVNRARSYLRAAFQRPLDAAGDPRAAAGLSNAYGLRSNPVSLTRRVAEFERTHDAVLSDEELRGLWANLPSDVAAVVELTVRMGGQRAEQICNATLERGQLRMLDSKGARAQARIHSLPIPPQAMHLVPESGRVTEVSPQRLRDAVRSYSSIRRTIESRMGELGIRAELRNRIQSHNLSGVAERSYNRSDWGPQLLAALTAWNEWLDGVAATVTLLRRA